MVNHLLDSAEDSHIVSVCAFCEREIGPMRVAQGQLKSHGFCKRHAATQLKGLPQDTIDEFMRRFLSDPEAKWPPDLKEHPELVEGPPKRKPAL